MLLSQFMGEIEGGLSEEVRFSLAEIRDHFFREEFRRKMICGVQVKRGPQIVKRD